MRIAIIGSRPESRVGRTSPELVARDRERRLAIEALVARLPDGEVVVSGGAPGADTWAENAATKRGIVVVRCIPPWVALGRRAGFVRNAVIADISDRAVAFYGADESPGTKSCVALFRKLGKWVEEFDWRGDIIDRPPLRKTPFTDQPGGRVCRCLNEASPVVCDGCKP